MSNLTSKGKKELISEFSTSKNDTGSSQVQCALFTKQIENLSNHLKIHKKDFSSKRGLLILVSKRRRILDYLKSKSNSQYESLIKTLGIRK